MTPLPRLMPSAPQTANRPARRHRGDAAPRDEQEIGVLNLAEEAFHLLRSSPPADLCLYYLGAAPFALAAFIFWAEMSRSHLASGDAVLGALLLALVYLWMKYWQARFCRRLWERLQPSGARIPLSRGRQAREFAAQAFLHAFSLPLRLASTLFLGWTIAFFQNASVLALTQPDDPRPLRRVIALSAHAAHANWRQNYLVLLLVLMLSVFVWINTLGAAFLVPLSLKVFLGVESVFTRGPESAIFNTTFLFGTALLALLIVDPLLKAVYTLRCFRFLARKSGADLLSRLDRAEDARRRLSPRAATLAIALAACLATGTGAAQDHEQSPPDSESLARSIETTLADDAYQWRLPRPASGENTGPSEKGWLVTALNDLADSFERSVERAGEAIDDFFRELFQRPDSPRATPSTGDTTAARDIGNAARFLFIAVIAIVLAWIVYLIIRRGPRPVSEAETPAGSGAPVDLESESIVATQLPEDEWLRLAREQLARGDHRLAVRALFLANLSHLGERGLLKVARFKSNRDYSRELSLKSRSLPGLIDAFQENIGLFERAWYGLHEIGHDAVERFTRNSERIARPPGDPPRPPA